MERGSLYLVLAAVLYSMQPVFVKLAYAEVPGFLMFSLRFFGMLFVFLPMAYHFRNEVWGEIRQWKKFLLPAISVFLSMALFTVSIYFTENATLTGLLIKSNSIFIPLMTAALFIEERRVLLSKKFLLGILLAGIGVVGVVTGGKALTLAFSLGVLLVLISQLSWSTYAVSIKRLISKKNRLVVLSFIYPLAFLFSLPFAYYDLVIIEAPFTPVFLVIPIVSGIVVGLAHSMQFKAIQTKGLIVTNAFSLTAPLMTGIIAFALFGELLSALQILFGAVLITGGFLIISCKCDIRTGD